MMGADWDDLGQSVPWASTSTDFSTAPADANTNKKRRVQRACDICRRKKIRCDATTKLSKGGRCSNCASSGSKCTFSNESTKRGPSKAYVDGLENKLASMEELLRKLAVRVDIEAELAQHASEFPSYLSGHSLNSVGRRSGSPQSTGNLGTLTAPGHNHPATVFDHDDVEYESTDTEDDDEEPLPQRITKTLEEFNIAEGPSLFHGKSSGFGLLKAANLLKKEQGIQPAPDRAAEPEPSSEWERRLMAIPPPSTFTFPPEDLARILFDLFFLHFTPFLPVIHQPTFEAQYKSGLHHKNRSFAKSVLLVCAIGSRYSDDPRVYLEEIGRQSAGWKWFTQIGDPKPPAYAFASLHDIQCYVMLAYFLQTTTALQPAWTISGHGIRLAQERGMHRKKAGKGPISLYDEQEKRAFWCLIIIDRYMSTSIGRPLACQDEDFDLDFPVEVDDEYWSLPEQDGAPIPTPHQPTGVPSKISAFVAALKLSQIAAFALRTVYSINKSRALLGFGGEKWDQQIVSELDSRMNKWIDAVPAHLKWDPNRTNETHFVQSANLYSAYYYLQICIHRPFLHPAKGASALSFPSLSISTHAARSCSHVLEALKDRGMRGAMPVLDSAIHSGVVLLMAVWGAKKTGVSVDSQGAMRDVNQCIDYLRGCESHWQCARLMGQVLKDLANCGDLDLTSSALTPPSLKRGYSQLQDSLPSPPDSSGARSASGDDRRSQSPGHKQAPTRSSQPSSVTGQPANRAMPPVALPPAPTSIAPPMSENPLSPTSQFLQSYVATLPLDGMTTSANPLFQSFDPAMFSNPTSVVGGDGLTSTSFPISTNFASSKTKTMDWDSLLKLGSQSSGPTYGPGPEFGVSNSFQFAGMPGSSSSAGLQAGDPYLGYQGFEGSMGFAAEAQAFLGGGGMGADDVDWASILNFGSSAEHIGMSKANHPQQ
ncbi:hypothetical protein DL93DRAFT_2112063 [Clavulina sp. PMI_390]|nr:hypothetical protein DL93DRAFT_2112063 [Clavulina sp. PMI_390]